MSWSWYDPAPYSAVATPPGYPAWWPPELIPATPVQLGVPAGSSSPWPNFVFSFLGSSSTQPSDQVTYQRNFQFELQPLSGPTRAAAQLSPLMYEGMSNPPQSVLSGILLTESYVAAMDAFYHLEHLTLLTDNRGMTRTILPTNFQYTRMQSATHQWKSSFQLTFYVFNTVFPFYVYSPSPI